MIETGPGGNVPNGGGCIEAAEAMSERRQRGSAYTVTDPVLQQVGDTPLVPHPNDTVFCKMERQSPLSHKDRLAVGMLLELKGRGQRVVEASSGNMAGGVALVCNRLGHPCTIVSPEMASPIKMGSSGSWTPIWCGKYVNEQDGSIRIVGVDVEHSNVSRDFHGREHAAYDTNIEGLGQYRTTDAIDFDAIDEMVPVSDEDAVARAKHETAANGLLLGTSSGAVMEVARSITDGTACVVAIVHDGSEQHLHQVEDW